MNQIENILQEIRPEYDFKESEDFIADQMLDMLEGAEFHGRPVDEGKALELIFEAQELLASAGL